MAKNLVEKGRNILAFDVNAPLLQNTFGDRMSWAKSPADVASQVKTIVTMLPNNDIVTEVYTGENGVLKAVQPESLLIDSSTVDPAVSQNMAALVEQSDAVFVDAPVSGGVNAAKAGTLTFMVGAAELAQYESAKEILLDMGKTVYHCGAVGSGQAVKICNNMLLAISMIGTCETMNLGIQ